MTPNIDLFSQSFATMQNSASTRVKTVDNLSLDATSRTSAATADGIALSPESRLRNLIDRFRRDTSHAGALELSVPLSDNANPSTNGYGTGDPKLEKNLDLLLRMFASDEDDYRRLKSQFSEMMKSLHGSQEAPSSAPAVAPVVAEGATVAADPAADSGSGQSIEVGLSTSTRQFVRNEARSAVSIVVDAQTGRPVPLNEGLAKAVQQARATAEQTGANTVSKVFEGGVVNLQFKRVSGRVEIQNIQFVASQGKADPLVLDLEGDGIDLRSPEEGVLFDINGDGQIEKTGWIKGDDALLVLDRNGNGIVDDGRELFGDQNGAADGFQELRKLDSNRDSQIDRRDNLFRALKLYRDINGNGKTEKGELVPLEAAGIASISLKFQRVAQELNGNSLLLNGRFTTDDGRTGQVADVLFGYR